MARQITYLIVRLAALLLMFSVAVLLLASVAAAWLLGTEDGLEWAAKQANQRVPGLQIGAVSGEAFGPLGIENLSYTSDSVAVELAMARLDWDLSSLMNRQLTVTDLQTHGLRVKVLQSTASGEAADPSGLPDIDLPIALDIANAALTDAEITIQSAETNTAILVQQLQLAGQWQGTDLELQQLKAELQIGDNKIQGQLAGKLTFSDHWPIEAQIDWGWQGNNLAPMQASSRLAGLLDGTQAKLDIQHQNTAPWGLRAEGHIAHPLADPNLTFKVRIPEALNLSQLSDSWPGIIFSTAGSGPLSVTGPPAGLQVKGLFHAKVTAAAEAAIDLPEIARQREFIALVDLGLASDHVDIRQAIIEEADTVTELTIGGQVAFAAAANFDLKLKWRQMQWPLIGPPQVASKRGELLINGPLSDYAIKGLLDIKAPWGPKIDLTLAGRGSEVGVSDLKLTGRWDEGNPKLAVENPSTVHTGSLQAQADLSWSPKLIWQADVQAEGLNPAWLENQSAWPGNLNVVARTRGEQQLDGFIGEVELIDLTGILRDYEIVGEGRIDLEGAAGNSLELIVFSGKSQIALDGKIQPDLNLQWDLRSPDLAELLPLASGALRSEGRLIGAIPDLRIQGGMRAENFRIIWNKSRYQAAKIDAKVDISMNETQAAGAPLVINLNLQDGLLNDQILQSLSLTSEGLLPAHQINLDAQSPQGEINLALQGALSDLHEANGPVWKFKLKDGTAKFEKIPVWKTPDQPSGLVSSQRIHVDKHCWLAEQTRFCSGFDWQPGDHLTLNSRLEQLPTAWLSANLPGTRTTGEINGDIQLDWDYDTDEASPKLNANLTISPGAFEQYLDEEWEPILDWDMGEIKAYWLEETAGASLDLKLVDRGGGGGYLRANPSLALSPDAPIEAAPLSGKLELLWNNLQIIPLFFPDIAELDGKLTADIALSGNYAEPQLTGEFVAKGSNTSLPRLGITLSQLEARLRPTGQQFEFNVTAVSDGKVELSGNGQWQGNNADNLQIKARIQGENFQAMNTPDAVIWLSPDIKIEAADKLIKFAGDLSVPKASITPQDLEGQVVASEDQIIVTDEVQASDEAWKLRGDLNVSIGDAVKFDGFGLKADLGGKLTVLERPDQLTRARGEILIREGSYKAFGQELAIERGKLLYTGGPVTTPAVDVRAVRVVRQVTAGVHVRGTLERPDLKLYSEPPLSPTETLSYLLFGRPLTKEDGQEASALEQAALALQLKGTELVATKLAKQVGIEEVGIATTESGNAQLVLGKYLTPKLYVSYGVGVLENSNQLILRYLLSDNWRAEATSTGDSSGADIYYTIER